MARPGAHPDACVYTVGHSNHAMEVFIDLLRVPGIQVLVDTRSSPYSRYASQFNRESLKAAMGAVKIKYVYMGWELGGQPAEAEFYDDEGHVLYGKLAEWGPFCDGINRLIKGIETRRVALVCSEEAPAGCHRRLLVGRVLGERGVSVRHIRGDGRIQSEEEVAREAAASAPESHQALLFPMEEPAAWRSIQSVSGKRQPSGFSDPLRRLASGG